MSRISDVKTLKGIQDNLQDALLETLERLTVAHFKAYTGVSEVPNDLEFIIIEVMVKRYNKLDAEGFTSKTVEGLSMSFSVNDFEVYDAIFKRQFKTVRDVGVKFI